MRYILFLILIFAVSCSDNNPLLSRLDHIDSIMDENPQAAYNSLCTIKKTQNITSAKNVDMKWMDHIDAMEELKRGIRLRAYGQRDPVIEYRIEGFDMFDEMIASIREDTARMMLTIKVQKQQNLPRREQVAKPTGTSADQTDDHNQTIRKGKKIGRNDPCPCGSGKKYKKCCGRDE